MASDERHDILLLQLAQACGSIENILDAFMGFLSRKTDFFVIQTEELSHMGFRTGVAEKMLLTMFKKYQKNFKQPAPKKTQPKEEKPKVEAKSNKTQSEKSVTPKPAPVIAPMTAPAPANSSLPSASASASASAFVSAPSPSTLSSSVSSLPVSPPASEATSAPQQQPAPESQRPHSDIVHPRDLPNGIVAYNGAVTDRYRWAQTLKDVTVQIPVPKGTTSKQLSVSIQKSNLKVLLKGREPALVEGTLDQNCKPNDSMWTLEDNQALLITLEKPDECFWKTVIKGDPEIDTTKVDSTKDISDYDQETQAEIRRLMWDQDQKRKGLKTSEDIKHEDIMRKAWDAEGSPFKGQPFDMSKVNFGGASGAGGGDGAGEFPFPFPPPKSS
eukprot:c8495_g1_i2.p1 GENE.c8495_g1_i2~~c8495_g1_i2.p1  ORF type:complete len:399 (+),score=90.94 c8495_g1_i2:40-1197(+)